LTPRESASTSETSGASSVAADCSDHSGGPASNVTRLICAIGSMMGSLEAFYDAAGLKMPQ
jgi:hypothetical protein